MAGDIKKVGLELTAEGAKDFTRDLKSVSAATKEAYSELKLAQSQYDKNTSATQKLADRQKYLEKVTEEYAKKEEILKAQLEDLENAENRDETAIAKKRAELNQCQAKLNQYEKALEDVTRQIKTHSAQLQEWGQKLQDIGGKMTTVGDTMSKYVTAPIVAGAAASIKAFNDVDEGMDTIIKKTGATGDAADEMRQIMENMATSIPTDFATAGEAIGEVNTRFGVTGEKLEELSAQYIKFAELNNTDVSSSIDVTQKALAAYGLGAESASGYLDRLNKVGQETGVSVDKLSDGIVSNATAFKELGMNLDEATVFMGMLEKSGANSETVLNGMRKALKNATAEGKPLNVALEELQTTIENGTGSIDGLTAAYDIFGKSGDQIYGAVKDGTIDFRELAGAVEAAGGSVSNTFEETLDPLDRFKQVVNELKLLGADIVETAGPMIVDILQRLSDAVGWLREKWDGLSDSQKEMILKMLGIAAAVGPVLSIVGRLVSGIGGMMTMFGTAAGSAGVLGGAMTLLTGPVGIVIAIIGALIAVGVLLYQNWDEICAWAQNLKEKVTQAWEELKTKVIETVENLKATVTEKWENLKTAVTDTVEGIKTTVKEKWDSLKNTVTTAAETIRSSVSQKWEATKTTVGTILGAMVGNAQQHLGVMQQAYNNAGGGIQGIMAAAGAGISNIWSGAMNVLDTLTGGKLSSISNWFTTTFSNIWSYISDIAGKLANIFNFSWSLPRIQLPHFSWTWHNLGHGLHLPSISVSWYRKAYDQVYAYNSPSLIGVGDGPRNDAEIITGENHMVDLIGNVMDEKNAALVLKLDSFMNMVAAYLLALVEKEERPIVFGDQLVGALTPELMKSFRAVTERAR